MALGSKDHVAVTSRETEAGVGSGRQQDRIPDKGLHLNFQVLHPCQLDFVQFSMSVSPAQKSLLPRP